MNIKFNTLVKHERVMFSPAIVYGFSEANVAAYFIAAGMAAESEDPADVEIAAGEVTVDPDTVFGTGPNRGKLVLEN